MDNSQLTQADREWLSQPVDVEVPQDDRKWLDSMLEMKQAELINYAVYSYEVPEKAAEVLGRQELIQMIVMSNRAGKGGSVLRTRYRYLKGLEGKIPTAIEPRPGSKRRLYLTRGEGATLSVYDKSTDKWHNCNQLGATVAEKSNVGVSAAQNSSSTPPPTSPPQPAISVETFLPVLDKVKFSRAQLEAFATDLGIENVDDLDTFATNQTLIDAIKARADHSGVSA